MASEMRILTVRQPWAYAIIVAGKDVENRTRNIAGEYRGPVAIHAGAAYDRDADGHPEIRALAKRCGVETMSDYLIPYGHRAYRSIIGVVDITDVHDAEDCIDWGYVGPEHIDHSWCSRWADADSKHLKIANPRQLDQPIPFRGALGLRRLDDDTTARIYAEIGA